MRTLHSTFVVSGLALALVCFPGCKKNKKADNTDNTAQQADNNTPPDNTPPDNTPPDDNAKPANGDGSGTGTGTGTGGGEGAGGGTGMTNKMANCPSAAPGAVTKVAQTKKAVVVTVTAKDPKDKAAVAEIQKRAALLATLDASADTDVKHTGKGTGGGGLGKCPVVMDDVTVKMKKEKTGASLTLTPKDASKLADLAKTAKDRAAALAAMPAADDKAQDDDKGQDDDSDQGGDDDNDND